MDNFLMLELQARERRREMERNQRMHTRVYEARSSALRGSLARRLAQRFVFWRRHTSDLAPALPPI